MTTKHHLQKAASMAAICAAFVMMSGCSYVMIEAPKKEINMWNGYASEWHYQSESIIDTDPLSRDRVTPFISDRFNIAANELSRSHRMHLTFERNKSQITTEHKQAIETFSERATSRDYSSVVVVGFTDDLGSKRQNKKVGTARAENTFKAIFEGTDLSAPQRFHGYSPQLFKESAEQGRRAEVWLVP